MNIMGWGMFPPPPFNDKNTIQTRRLKNPEDEVCDELWETLSGFLMGFDTDQCNDTMVQWASTSTSSVRTVAQYAQGVNTGIVNVFNLSQFVI